MGENMKIELKNKKNFIPFICIIAGVILFVVGIFYELKNDKLGKVKDAIENVFFYLPNENYDDLNQISDYCKISLVYGTDYLKNYTLLSKDDYDTVVKKNGVKAYSKDNILKAIKNILGDNANINFDLDEDDDYSFLISDNCKFGNDKIKTLSYNESKESVFSIDDDEENTSKLYVKWEKPEYDGDLVKLTAKALLAVKNVDGGYDVFADSNLNYQAGTVSGSNVKSQIEDMYDYRSMDHVITLKKQGDNYIWIKYEVIDNIYRGEILE